MTEPEKAKPKKPPRYPRLSGLNIRFDLDVGIGPDLQGVSGRLTRDESWPYEITFGCETITFDEIDRQRLRLLLAELPKLR